MPRTGPPRGGRGGGRPGHGRGRGIARGDVRIAVLTLLAEEPMHGYHIMSELTERSNGVWEPSPGSIYPLLQQLADEGLVTHDDEGGRKVFRLTEAGRTAAADEATGPPVWERIAGGQRGVDLRDEIGGVAVAARQVLMTGSKEQATAAAEILSDARKRLYQLLADQ